MCHSVRFIIQHLQEGVRLSVPWTHPAKLYPTVLQVNYPSEAALERALVSVGLRHEEALSGVTERMMVTTEQLKQLGFTLD